MVFISYSSADYHFAVSLASELRREGIDVWLDREQISIGESLVYKIRDGIDRSALLIAVMSSNSIQSEWVLRELDVAITQEIRGGKVKVLPLRLDDSPLPGFLLGKLYSDFTIGSRYQQAMHKLIASIRSHFEPRS